MFGWFKRRDTIQQYYENPVNHLIKYIEDLPDEEVELQNNLLPWASYINDVKGRPFSKPPFPTNPEFTFDVLHHVKVLYHLSSPIKHLNEVLPMLDTHIATVEDELHTFSYNETDYRYKRYKESGCLAPFAGIQDHTKWLLKKDLVKILENNRFSFIDIAEQRDERNGKRILLYAHKEPRDHIMAKSC